MLRIVNKIVEGKRLEIDRSHFENSTFRNCELVFSGENTSMTWNGCEFDGGDLVLIGSAASTAKFLDLWNKISGAEGKRMEPILQEVERCAKAEAWAEAKAYYSWRGRLARLFRRAGGKANE